MKTAIILTLDTRFGGYGSVEAVLLGESDGRRALETFAKDRGAAADITHIIGDNWSLSIPYKGVDGNMYQNVYTATIMDATSAEGDSHTWRGVGSVTMTAGKLLVN